MKTVKFGGSSLASAEKVRRVCDIITADPARRLVVGLCRQGLGSRVGLHRATCVLITWWSLISQSIASINDHKRPKNL